VIEVSTQELDNVRLEDDYSGQQTEELRNKKSWVEYLKISYTDLTDLTP